MIDEKVLSRTAAAGRLFVGGFFIGFAADPHLPFGWLTAFAVAGVLLSLIGAREIFLR